MIRICFNVKSQWTTKIEVFSQGTHGSENLRCETLYIGDGNECDFKLVSSGPFQKADRREVAFTQGYRNKSSKPVQNRFEIWMVRKSPGKVNQKSGRFANVPFHYRMNRKGRSSSGPLSGTAGFLWVHASEFHLLSPRILEKLSFPAEVSVFFFLFFRHKLLIFHLSEPPNSFYEIILLIFYF